MQSKLKPKLDPKQRKELIDAGLITLKKKGRASYVFLTEKAWAWASDHLDAPFSHTTNAAAPFASLLSTLKKYMTAQGIPLVEMLNPSETISSDEKKALRPTPEKAPGATAGGGNDEHREQRVKRAYLEASGGQWDVRVRMADMRKKLMDIPPKSLDAILRKMQLDQKLILYPLDDPSEISPEDDAAVVVAGGRKNHILYMTATKFV